MSDGAAAAPSLADRITKDEPLKSWADEVNSPATEGPASREDNGISQTDGASGPFGGSQLQEPDYEVQVKLADMQADPNNPLFSAKTFEELDLKPEIQKGVIGMNFRKPSKVQEKTLPLLMMNPPRNLIGQSQSGTGKTAAFVLNILSRIDISTPEMQKTTQALVLAPSRELARQICGVVRLMGHFMDGLLVDAAVPVEAAQRGRKIEAAVVVGTPGTVQDLIKRRSMDVRKMKILVLDEADNMLDQQGLGDQCSRVKAMLPKDLQIVLFSATFPEHVVRYAHTFAPNANEMTLRHEDLTVEGIKQIYLDCDNEDAKYETLVKFYGMLTIGSSIIFVKRKDTAAKLEQRMGQEGHKVVALTSAYEGTQRDVVIDAFRMGHAKVLISTNVLARGIDVSSVSMVVNYDIPDTQAGPRQPTVADPQTYLHRIGRTGRFGRVGVAVSFVSSKDDWEKLMAISSYFGCEITRLDTGDWDELEEQVTKIIKSSRAGTNFQGGISTGATNPTEAPAANPAT